MTEADSAIQIVEGVLGIVALLGLPVAAIIAPITSIISGIFGFKEARKK
jgi:hypothetical protein